jgi:hypothetical protein
MREMSLTNLHKLRDDDTNVEIRWFLPSDGRHSQQAKTLLGWPWRSCGAMPMDAFYMLTREDGIKPVSIPRR